MADLNLSSLNGRDGFRINGIPLNGISRNSVGNAGDVNGDGIDDIIIGLSFDQPNNSDSGQSYVIFGNSKGFSSSFNLSSLNGSNGFRINGIALGDSSGLSVSGAGDINGDSIDDIIISAPYADPNGSLSGQSYVIFGNSKGFSSSFNLSSLNGSNGFRINGLATGDLLGLESSVSNAGDVNGDGIGDFILGSPGASKNSGQSYVIFGIRSGFGSSFNLSSLNGSNGFRINGIATDDSSGISVSGAGDLNGDGIDDIIIGAVSADPNGDGSGQSYVVFGNSKGFSSSLNLSSLNGSNGFRINGIAAGDQSGAWVSNAGDVNGDSIDDIIIGAVSADPNGDGSGQSYVVFGNSKGFSSSLNLSSLNGSNGFRINGIAAGDQSGTSATNAGDVNGDGIDDLVIGAPTADPSGDRSGQIYVIFGNRNGFSSSLNLSNLNGTNGFILNGTSAGAELGRQVSTAGDINADGINDLIIGEYRGSRSYVIFGSRTLGSGLPNIVTTLNVNTTVDQNDGSADNGLSLRDAIIIANRDTTKAYTIQLQSGVTYSLTREGTGEDQALTGDLDIRNNITLVTNGSPAVINADSLINRDIVLDVIAGAKLNL